MGFFGDLLNFGVNMVQTYMDNEPKMILENCLRDIILRSGNPDELWNLACCAAISSKNMYWIETFVAPEYRQQMLTNAQNDRFFEKLQNIDRKTSEASMRDSRIIPTNVTSLIGFYCKSITDCYANCCEASSRNDFNALNQFINEAFNIVNNIQMELNKALNSVNLMLQASNSNNQQSNNNNFNNTLPNNNNNQRGW